LADHHGFRYKRLTTDEIQLICNCQILGGRMENDGTKK